MRATDTALDTLGFSQDQKDGLYKGTIAIAYLGNQKWKQKGREEQAEPDGMEYVTKASELLGIETDWFVDTFMKPKLMSARILSRRVRTWSRSPSPSPPPPSPSSPACSIGSSPLSTTPWTRLTQGRTSSVSWTLPVSRFSSSTCWSSF